MSPGMGGSRPPTPTPLGLSQLWTVYEYVVAAGMGLQDVPVTSWMPDGPPSHAGLPTPDSLVDDGMVRYVVRE